jgi:glycosyltransferase involved in cell wall biosynthesis
VTTLSIVVPAYNEEDGIQQFLVELKSRLKLLPHKLEIIIVNDGSTDRTRELVIESNWDSVKIINLVSNSGHMAALEAGLRHSSGDLIITMDSDLQHPPEMILEMLNVQEKTNCDVVLAVRMRGNETSMLRKIFSKSFYRILSKVTDINFENDAGEFRLMTKRVVETILALPENQKIFRFLVGAFGFKSEKISYRSPQREFGSSKYHLKNLVKLAVSSIIGFSTAPLTAIFIGGIATFFVGISYLIWILLNYRDFGESQGWTSLMATLVSLSSVQIIALGIIGRYLSQTLIEIRKRPSFIVDTLDVVKRDELDDEKPRREPEVFIGEQRATSMPGTALLAPANTMEIEGETSPVNARLVKVKSRILEIFWISVLLLSCFWFFSKSYRLERSFGIWQDNEFLISPILRSMSNQSQGNGIPSYLPEFLGGLDIQGFSQFTPFYPLYFIGSSIFNTPASAIQGLNLLVHLHLLIFVFGAYFLLRILGVNGFVAAFGGILLVFNSNTLNYSAWINILAGYSWLPWILGALFRALKKNSYASWSVFYFFCLMLIFASPSQPMIHAFLLVGILITSEWMGTRKKSFSRGSFLSSLRKCLLLFPIFLALVGPVLGPAIVSIGNQIRWIGNFPAVKGYSKIPFEAFLTSQLEFEEISDLIFPPTSSLEVGGAYLGLIVFGLVIYGLFHLYSQRVWKVFFFVGLYSLLSAFGSNLGFAYLNYNIPLLNLIREPGRFLVIVHLTFGICAALSLNDLCRKLSKKVDRVHLSSEISGTDLLRKTAIFLGAGMIFSLSLLQSNLVNWKSPDVSFSEYESGNWRTMEQVLTKINELDPEHNFRVIFGGKINTQKASMFAAFFEVRTLNVYLNPLPFGQFNSVYFYNNLAPSFKELLGARFLVCDECTVSELESYPGYDEVWNLGSLKLLENKSASSYATIPRNVRFFQAGVSNFPNELRLSDVPSDSVFVQSQDVEGPTSMTTNCVISKDRQSGFQLFEISAKCETEAILVINSFNDGNWRANVNGIPATPYSVNGNLVGLSLEPGSNRVELFKEPVLRDNLLRYGGVFVAAYLILALFIGYRARLVPTGSVSSKRT